MAMHNPWGLRLFSKEMKWINALQIVIFIYLMGVLIIYLPWSLRPPISEFPVEKYGDPPADAAYYGINHGRPYFYEDSPIERPATFWFVLVSFICGYVALVASIFMVHKKNGGDFSRLRFRLR